MRPGLPRKPEPRQGNPEPMIPAPAPSAALRISYGGCQWCGARQDAGGTACLRCITRERAHAERMNALREHEQQLKNQLLEQQLTQQEAGS